MLNYKNGEAAAFDMLYLRHKGGLYRYILRQLGGQTELANELFQDVWMNLIKSRERYQATAKFTTYLYRIAHNRLVDHWRASKPEPVELDQQTLVDQCAHLPEQKIEQQQLKSQLLQHIAVLPEEQRNTFLLQQEAAFSLQQIADITGVDRETVKSRLRYAMNKLRQSLVLIS